MPELRGITWNALSAGYEGSDNGRSKKQIKFLNNIRPDVFIMQEAREFLSAGHTRLYEFEAQTGMRGFVAPSTDTRQHLAVFIRSPLRPVSFITDQVHFHHGLASLRVSLPCQAELTFISAHFCPAGADIRRREASFLASQVDPEKLMLLAGDFNSASPHDPIPEDWAELPARQRARYVADDQSHPDHRVLGRLESAGWVDVGHQHEVVSTPTVPASGFRHTEFPTMRCDYMMATPSLAEKCRSYEVIRNQETDDASDHYLVMATLLV